MRAENHVWWKYIRNNAERTGTKDQRYADMGQWATIAFQTTGDKRYAQKAWKNLTARMNWVPPSRNWTREFFIQHVIMYDWLYPALTPDQRKTFYTTLNSWGDLVLGKTKLKNAWGTRTHDTDELHGQYFSLALIDLATGPDNPRAGTFLSSTWTDTGKLKRVGGLDATAADHSTMRNAIKLHMQMAAGGEWVESSQYNIGTLRLIALGSEAVRTATGNDHFPEVTAMLRQAALVQLYTITPDLKNVFQWGDVEHPHVMVLWDQITTLGLLAGVTQDDPNSGPYVHQMVLDLFKKHGFNSRTEPWVEMFWCYNPYAPHKDWRKVLPPCHYAPGMGVLFFTDWKPSGSLFVGHMPTRIGVDHEVEFFGDFQLYRKGEWAVTHPIGYGGSAIQGEGVNGMLIAGLSSMVEYRGPVAQECGPGGEFAYLAGTTSGKLYRIHYRPPPPFLHEWTRSLFYLPAKDRQLDTIVVFDRVKASDPRKLPLFDKYSRDDVLRINGASALLEWIIHSPVEPTMSQGSCDWRTPGGQSVHVATLLPAKLKQKVYSEKALWPKGHNLRPEELKFQARFMAGATGGWQTFFNVVQVSGPKQTGTTTHLTSMGRDAEGVLVVRPKQDDILVVFGARPASRVLKTGYTLTWEANSANSRLYLLDLATGQKWTASVDSNSSQGLSVSPAGIAQLTVAGSGSHTIKLSAR
jgi:hypothetical protein